MPVNNTMLEQAISGYMQWMISNGYSPKTVESYERILKHFLTFTNCRNIAWHDIFTIETLNDFQKGRSKSTAHAVRGLSRYLFRQNRISMPIEKKAYRLPKIYEDYLVYHERSRQAPYRRIKQIKRVLAALHDYLQRHKIDLSSLKIDHIDAFLAEFFTPFAPRTCKAYRSVIRGFLKYLYHERRIIKKDLAPLVVGAPMFAQAKPPTFLRPHEVQKLFAGVQLSTPLDIRTYATLHLAYTMGLRPDEICSITLDDISLSRGELTVRERKTDNPVILPMLEEVVKAIAAYLIGVRPQSEHRTLFLSLNTPFGPISPTVLSYHIKTLMRKVNLPSTAYWLRHTYAQNLLQAGASIYEIKEMLGHDSIESTRKYLQVDIKLMRKVLFDEEL
ncbi:MAG: tyrosine-type recombinase/integrase [Deltaproteobacteria bacterium]|nr:tyrosine-type recombinase/integrase [Deltaproteobacteria bacterium]